MRLPERIDGDVVTLRVLRAADAGALHEAVVTSLDHLRPWMPWAAEEPVPLATRRDRIAGWRREWRDGRDVTYGVFAEGDLAGMCGLHRRIGPRALEIGYWIRASHVRRGLATAAAGLAADTVLARPDVDAVEIHHDRANVASAAVPRALGFELVDERPDPTLAPAELAIECVWRRTR